MESINTDKTNLRALANSALLELKERYPRYSSTQIAKMIGMSQSTFSRIENEQTEPSLASITKLLTSVGKVTTLREIIDQYNPEMATAIKESLPNNIDNKLLTGKMEEYFRVYEYRRIILLASTRSGTTRAEVRDNFGSMGERKLDELLQLKLLEDKGGKIFSVDIEGVFAADADINRATVVSLIEHHYDSKKFGTGSNWLSVQTQSVDFKRAMPLIRKKLQRLYNEIYEEILSNEDYIGEDKIFISMATDMLTNSNNLLENTSEVLQ